MKATYNTTTRELVVTSEEIQDFEAIIPQDQEEDYWDTVKDKAGNFLYDINLYNYGGGLQFQYVNLVDDEDEELTCGDDYQSVELILANI